MNTFEKARQFIYRNARPIDLAIWQYNFENGSDEAVLNALSFYQNDDGGFGHGLEADCFNPNSSPIQTWQAAEILHGINFSDKSHPVVRGILRYLESGADFNTEHNQWLNTVPTNNDFPHAIWWEHNENYTPSYNPTASLAGFIVKFADKNTALYEKGCAIAKQAIEWFTANAPFEEMHTTCCFIQLYEHLCEAKSDLTDMDIFRKKLIQQVNQNICREPEKWFTEYVAKPSNFMNSRDSIFFADNAELAEAECGFIRQSQLEDGSFPVTWKWWTDYKEFEVAENYWKSIIAIKNMKYLKGIEK